MSEDKLDTREVTWPASSCTLKLHGLRGFTLIEAVIVMAVASILTAIAVPLTQSAIETYHLNSAVTAVSQAIATTRYQAIMNGYHFEITFSQDTTSYQVASKVPPAASFSNVGITIPWCTTADVSLSPTSTLEFYPGGTVVADSGSLTLTLTNGVTSHTITVSGVGDVSVQ